MKIRLRSAIWALQTEMSRNIKGYISYTLFNIISSTLGIIATAYTGKLITNITGNLESGGDIIFYAAMLLGIFGSVSYTHLDVYKRQILDSFHNGRIIFQKFHRQKLLGHLFNDLHLILSALPVTGRKRISFTGKVQCPGSVKLILPTCIMQSLPYFIITAV